MVCNPYCGRCRPPRERPRVCPDCMTPHFAEQGFPELCTKCGARLPERKLPPVLRCGRTGLVCANPCGRSLATPKDGCLDICRLNTPPSAEQLAEVLAREAHA